MPFRLLALADMKGNLVAAGILLFIGVLILRVIRSTVWASSMDVSGCWANFEV